MWEFFASLLGLGSSAYNAQQQAVENQKNRDWNEKMIAEAREWDLAQWNRQNQYNSPQQQMQRFSEAGLNPNLIYSQGTPGNAGSLSTSAPSGNQVAPHFDPSPLFQAAQVAMQRQQQQNNNSLAQSQIAFQTEQTRTEALRQITEIARAKNIDEQTKANVIANTLNSAIQPELIDQARLNTDIARWQRSISRLSAAEKQFNVDKILPLEELKLQIYNQAQQVGMRLSQAQISNLAATTQKALVEGRMLGLQFEYDKVLREHGISPDTPGWFKSLVHEWTWQKVVAPAWNYLFGSSKQDNSPVVVDDDKPLLIELNGDVITADEYERLRRDLPK